MSCLSCSAPDSADKSAGRKPGSGAAAAVDQRADPGADRAAFDGVTCAAGLGGRSKECNRERRHKRGARDRANTMKLCWVLHVCLPFLLNGTAGSRPRLSRVDVSDNNMSTQRLSVSPLMPAATLTPVWTWTLSGCSTIDSLDPPMSAFAPTPTPREALAVTPP